MAHSYFTTRNSKGKIILARASDSIEYAASKGKFDWRQNTDDPDVLEFVSEDAACQEASERGINPAEVR